MVIANLGGLVNSPFLFGVVGNQTGLSSLSHLSATCLINVVYSLAPMPLISVVKAVVSDVLFCCLSLLSSGNLGGKNNRLSAWRFINIGRYFTSSCLISLERSQVPAH